MGTWIELPMEEVAARYGAGESTTVLGRAYGVGGHTIWRRLRAAGVELRPPGAPPGNKYGLGNKSKLGRLHVSSAFFGNEGYLCTYTRERKQARIHRGCWEAHHGQIPEGHVIHHINGDRTDNRIGNLACLPHGEHTRLHAAERRLRCAYS